MQLNKVHIFDDFLPIEVVNKMEAQISKIPFRFALNLDEQFMLPKIEVKDSNLTNINRPGLLQCWAFENKQWDLCTNAQWTEEILKYLPFDYELQRVKINFNYQVSEEYKDKCMHPHCDMNEGGFTAIYYINDSDGDTVIFNEKTMEPFLNYEELSIKKRVKQKKREKRKGTQKDIH